MGLVYLSRRSGVRGSWASKLTFFPWGIRLLRFSAYTAQDIRGTLRFNGPSIYAPSANARSVDPRDDLLGWWFHTPRKSPFITEEESCAYVVYFPLGDFWLAGAREAVAWGDEVVPARCAVLFIRQEGLRAVDRLHDIRIPTWMAGERGNYEVINGHAQLDIYTSTFSQAPMT